MSRDRFDLPSNKKFGVFFSIVFFVIAIFLFFKGFSFNWAAFFLFLSFLFLIIVIFVQNILYPINLLWFRLGLIIGKVVSPIVLGLIFYLVFTPISILSYIFKRDELRIREKKVNSYWIKREYTEIVPKSFKDQF